MVDPGIIIAAARVRTAEGNYIDLEALAVALVSTAKMSGMLEDEFMTTIRETFAAVEVEIGIPVEELQ